MLKPEIRPVEVEATQVYREIGIRSHGKGIFHKPPLTGLELGSKRMFEVKPGDFVLNIVFAWEGAVALAGPAEAGLVASHRFPTFRAIPDLLDPRFLQLFFKTPPGLELLSRVSPGGAGRNRTLSRDRFLCQEVPLPPLAEQERIVRSTDGVADLLGVARRLKHAVSAELVALASVASERALSGDQWKTVAVADLVGATGLRNGRSERTTDDASVVSALTLASVRDGVIDLAETKRSPLSVLVAEPYLLRKGDVLVVRGNGSKDLVGRAGLVTEAPDKVIFPDLLIRVSLPAGPVLPEFFVAVWNSPLVRRILVADAKTTSGIWKVNQGNIERIRIPVPPLAEQRRIVAHLDAVREKVDTLKTLQTQTAAELDALLPSLLDKAFRGEL